MSVKKLFETFFVTLIFFIAVLCMFIIDSKRLGHVTYYLGIYGSLNILYLLFKIGISTFYKPVKNKLIDTTVSVIIPAYNESPVGVISTVESLLNQNYPIKEIFYVDDGSDNTDGFVAIKEMSDRLRNEKNPTSLIAHRLPENKGKRFAQLYGFKNATGDIFVTVDSDCELEYNAIKELLLPFYNESVMATTGHVTARNRSDNILTRLIDMRYENAFRVERAAQSVTGNVLVCSGPLSAYRKDVILDNIDHYENQTFLGKPVQFGDDRCLTNYAIAKGKTVYQSTSKCVTDVPTSLMKFLKQQLRWNKSFFRESIEAIKVGWRTKKFTILFWVIFELITWVVFGAMLILGLIIKPFLVGGFVALYYVGYITVSAYARNVHYILKHPFSYLISPLYGFLHICLLVPLRLYALLTIRVTKWGTR